MAIESNRLAVQATIQRSRTAVYLPLYRYNEILFEYEKYDYDNAQWVSSTLPWVNTNGQIILVQPSINALYGLKVWVGNGWKDVRIAAVFINPDTGKPWNPLQNF